jgi:hypothetical protein
MAYLGPWLLSEVLHTGYIVGISQTYECRCRIGVGRFTIPLSEDGSKPRAVVQHLFDGLGLLHKFRMTQGRVFYMSRYTHEGVVRRAYEDGYLLTTRMGLNANTPLKDAQDPCSTLLGAQVGCLRTELNITGIELIQMYSNLSTYPRVMRNLILLT